VNLVLPHLKRLFRSCMAMLSSRFARCTKPLTSSLLLGSLYASKMIMRPERETKAYRDPCLEQRDCQYGEGPLRESEPVPENAAPDPRAATQMCCGDDYGSQSVARPARAIQCGWHQDHTQASTPDRTAPATRRACCVQARSQPRYES
jgi:hypothetical protein